MSNPYSTAMSQSPSVPSTTPQDENEIELIDLLNVIWKWRYMILLGTLFSVACAALISMYTPKIYRVDMVLRPGILSMKNDGKKVYIDSVNNIRALINAGSFNRQILADLPKDKYAEIPKEIVFKTDSAKKADALKISYETEHEQIGLEVMQGLKHHMLQKYLKLVDYYKENYNNEIKYNETKIDKLNNQKKMLENDIALEKIENDSKIKIISNNISDLEGRGKVAEAKKEGNIRLIHNQMNSIIAENNTRQTRIEMYQERIQEIRHEIEMMSNNTQNILEDRNAYLSSEKSENSVLTSLILSSAIQQNISYLNSLRNEIKELNELVFQEMLDIRKGENQVKDQEVLLFKTREETRYQIEKLALEIRDLDTQKAKLRQQITHKTKQKQSEIQNAESEKILLAEQIKNLEYRKNTIENIQIIQDPVRSASPIRPKKKMMVALAFCVGLAFTVILAFFIEYIKRSKAQAMARITSGEAQGLIETEKGASLKPSGTVLPD